MNEQEIHTETDDTEGNRFHGAVTDGIDGNDDTEGNAASHRGISEDDDVEGNAISPRRAFPNTTKPGRGARIGH